MENQQLSDVKGKELVAAGHAFAKAIGMDTPLIEIAKMVSVLATRLDCALVRGDAHKQDVITWEKAMMAAIGEDGVGCVVRKIAELKAERDALAAENVALISAFMPKEIPTEATDNFSDTAVLRIDGDEFHSWQWVDNQDEVIRGVLNFFKPKTPATDAYLNVVRAEGVEMFAKHCDDNVSFVEPEDEELYTLMEEAATAFAAQLRAGKDGE